LITLSSTVVLVVVQLAELVEPLAALAVPPAAVVAVLVALGFAAEYMLAYIAHISPWESDNTAVVASNDILGMDTKSGSRSFNNSFKY